MTPTRLQLNHMLHGINGGPRSLITLEKGDQFKRAALLGVDGWLITDQRGKSIWVPLGAVAGVDVDLVPDDVGADIVQRGFEVGQVLEPIHPAGAESFALMCCGREFKNETALASHRRFKHPEAVAP